MKIKDKAIALTRLINWNFVNGYIIRLFDVYERSWSDDMGNTYRWTNRNRGQESGTRVWKSDTPFTSATLPVGPLLTLTPGVVSFNDPWDLISIR